MYSFHETQEDFERFYAETKKAYFKIFERMGLTAKATEASGGAFTQKVSYEFMVLTDAGEDTILYCDACDFCVNVEIAKEREDEKCTRCKKGTLMKARASEVGNVFDLGQKFAKDFDVTYADKDGKRQYPIMGCFGIGISRAMGVIVEKYHDERGIIWPDSVAPFAAHVLALGGANGEKTYESLQKAGIKVLYDDREISAGEKFAEADLIGIPWRIVVSSKLGDMVEVKRRTEADPRIVDIKEALRIIKK
jgi:prolyl-tRNA synthetase